MTACIAGLLLAHSLVPHVFAIGSIWESSLPWLVVLVPLIAIGALRRRNLASAVAALLLLLAWALLCLPGFTRHHAQVDGRLRVVTHNVSWNNPDPGTTARVLSEAAPDLVTLQDVRPDGEPVYAAALHDRLPFQVRLDRDEIWSRWAVHDTATLDLGEDWPSIHRAVVDLPDGPLVVYATHLPRPSPFTTRQSRDVLLQRLAREVAADRAPRLLVAGDLNTGELDTSLASLSGPGRLRDSAREAANGPSFTWPAVAPAVALDHVLARGLRPTAVRVLPATGSDHRPLLVQLR